MSADGSNGTEGARARRQAETDGTYQLATMLVDPPPTVKRGYPATRSLQRIESRKFWNRLLCGHLPKTHKIRLAELAGIDAEELDPIKPSDLKDIQETRQFTGKQEAVKRLVNPFDRLSFDNLIFSEIEEFDRYIFPIGVSFRNCIFQKKVRFISCVFYNTSFNSTEFCEDADFRNSAFDGLTGFGDSVFKGNSDFSESEFNGAVHFGSAVFGKESKFVLCKFTGPLSFQGATFSSRFPEFSAATFSQITTFTAKNDHWPKDTEATAEQSRESLAIIRYLIGRQGLPEQEHYFYRREMAFAARIGSWWQRLPYRAFGLFSDFGHSLGRPACWLMVVWMAGAAATFGWLAWPDPTLTDMDKLLTSAGFSFSNLFAFLGFTRLYFDAEFIANLPRALKFLAASQTVAGVILLFLLGLGLRNRFRLK